MNISGYTLRTLEGMLLEDGTKEDLLKAMKRDSRIGVKKLLSRYYRAQEVLLITQEKAEAMTKEERRLWEQGYTLVAGIDEAGRGPLAGPVVAASVVLPMGLVIEGVDDSKKLTPAKRDELYDIIMKEAECVGVGIISHEKIDEINIYQATLQAMTQAVNECSITPEYLLIDAIRLKNIPIPQLPIIGGDALSQSIAAASIIAKVTRDRIMVKMDSLYPGYNFKKHKGYGTVEHLKAIQTLGLCPIHRKSFTFKILA